MSSLWLKDISIERLNAMCPGTLLEAFQISFTEIGERYLVASMPVSDAVRQPMKLLHGGASAALAESVGSIAGYFACPEGYYVLGTEISANHLRSMKSGAVTATASPIHIGGLIQLWQIDIRDAQNPDKLICSARHSLMVRHY
ncbi:hotdog fold thioesterase [Celerinatantimonas sp. YJH-8]|uniref:hotdog fold thioesterase n=1 Tax=Celerinatantimonas sp. YJH-8 TaxID=3228714 RepID=UPI0038BE7005